MNFIKNFADLIKVKTIVTLIVIIVFAVLSLRGDITPDNVMIIVSTVIAFYFGTQYEKKVAPTQIEEAIPVEVVEAETETETEE